MNKARLTYQSPLHPICSQSCENVLSENPSPRSVNTAGSPLATDMLHTPPSRLISIIIRSPYWLTSLISMRHSLDGMTVDGKLASCCGRLNLADYLCLKVSKAWILLSRSGGRSSENPVRLNIAAIAITSNLQNIYPSR